MSIPNIDDILRVPGRLCIDPTNLAIAYPHGGIGIGVIRNILVKQASVSYSVTAEEFGKETVDMVYGGETWVLGAVLRSYDKDAIQKLFPNTSLGVSGQRVISHPGATREGHLLSSRTVKLLFSPDDTTNHPMVLLHKAAPLVEETAEFNLSLAQELGLAIMFVGLRDASNRVIAIGIGSDLTL